MAADLNTLVAEWIRYVKEMQIAGLKSDPNTGKLQYKRPVTADDVAQFLNSITDYSRDEISAAIFAVLKKQARQPPTNQAKLSGPSQTDSGNQDKSQRKSIPGKSPTRIGHDPLSVSDVDYKELEEDFSDTPGIPNPTEADVEEIFKILISKGPAGARKSKAPATPDGDAGEPETPEQKQEKKENALRKIKRAIRDKMTDGQRKALWRALNEV